MKNFRETFKKFRKYWFEDLVVDASPRWFLLLMNLILIVLTASITVVITRNVTISEQLSRQKDALIDFMVDDMVDCQEDVLEQGGQCIYEITYDGDVIKNIEVVRHTF